MCELTGSSLTTEKSSAVNVRGKHGPVRDQDGRSSQGSGRLPAAGAGQSASKRGATGRDNQGSGRLTGRCRCARGLIRRCWNSVMSWPARPASRNPPPCPCRWKTKAIETPPKNSAGPCWTCSRASTQEAVATSCRCRTSGCGHGGRCPDRPSASQAVTQRPRCDRCRWLATPSRSPPPRR